MSTLPEIILARGAQTERRFSVPAAGLRLGRSSQCGIFVSDPALSRNHCLFEARDGAIWVTDLASANGTVVNGEPLGADSRELKPGDAVSAGDVLLVVVEPGAPLPAVYAAPQTPVPEAATVDLGLGQSAPERTSSSGLRFALWGVALAVVAAAACLIVLDDSSSASGGRPAPLANAADAHPVLHSLTYEKVEANGEGIYRFALTLDGKGELFVAVDDVPKENRHLKKSVTLSKEARDRLEKLLDSDELYRLDPEYTGVPLKNGALDSFSLRVVRGTRVFSVSVENAQEPEAFRRVREQLETFSKNELGIWAIQFSADKLLEKSAEARQLGDRKWEERAVEYGNLAAALAAYSEAVFYLETLNPKPQDYGALVKRREEVAEELDKRYRDQRFLADRAINLGDWSTARRELRILCDLIPDDRDARHVEAANKLLDVESRLKKGGK